MRCRLARLLCLALAAASLGACADADQPNPTIAVAAGLRQVMPDLLRDYGRGQFAVSYSDAGTLRRHIASGAPIDLAILAGARDADRLIGAGLGLPGTRTVLASNELILIGTAEAADLTFETLDTLPIDARIALGHPASDPAGGYTREGLKTLGVWGTVAGHCTFARDARAVLRLIRDGEVVAGIVYATEIRDVPDIKLLDRAAGEWAPNPLVVAVGLSGSAHAAQVGDFLDYLTSPEARAIFERHGFRAP